MVSAEPGVISCSRAVELVGSDTVGGHLTHRELRVNNGADVVILQERLIKERHVDRAGSAAGRRVLKIAVHKLGTGQTDNRLVRTVQTSRVVDPVGEFHHLGDSFTGVTVVLIKEVTEIHRVSDADVAARSRNLVVQMLVRLPVAMARFVTNRSPTALNLVIGVVIIKCCINRENIRVVRNAVSLRAGIYLLVSACAAGARIGRPLSAVVPTCDLDTVCGALTILVIHKTGRVPAGVHIRAQAQYLYITDLFAGNPEGIDMIGELRRGDRVLITRIVVTFGIIFIILNVPVLITVAVIGIYPDVGAALIPAGKTGHVDIDLFIMREG